MDNHNRNFKQYKHLLFDLDNTLLDFNKSSHLAFADLMEHFNIESSKNLYEIYSPINAKFWHYFEKQKVSAQDLNTGRFKEFLYKIDIKLDENELADKYLDLLVHHSSWINGAEKLIKAYAKTHELHIITNGLSKPQHLRLEKHDMKQYFKNIFISEEINVSKPHELYFEKVHQTLNKVPKNEVLVIGDNPNSDIKGGHNFGFDTCWYDYRRNKKQSSKATFKVSDWNIFVNTHNA